MYRKERGKSITFGVPPGQILVSLFLLIVLDRIFYVSYLNCLCMTVSKLLLLDPSLESYHHNLFLVSTIKVGNKTLFPANIIVLWVL